VFLEAARSGGLAPAARALGLSEATVGRRLRRLEAGLRTRIFERLPNRLVLTPAGQELVAAAEAMRAGATTLARRAAAQAIAAGAAVRISATKSVSLFLAAHLHRLIAATTADHPEIAILTDRAPADLAERDAEIALRMRRPPEQGALTARRIGRIAFALYAERGYWAAHGAGAGAMIGLPQTTRAPSQSRWLDDAAAARGAAIRLRLDDVALRHRAACDGLGITLLPCFLGDGDARLVRVVDPPPVLMEDIYLLVHEDMRGATPVTAVAVALAQLFKGSRMELGGIPLTQLRLSSAAPR
jgi:DNA-binding transcriptional LysR family regulator